MQRIVFFTAGPTATADELTAIGKLNTAAEKPYEVLVANGAANSKYGETNRLIPCDFVAGAIPTIYDAIDEIDPDNLPGAGPTVADGQSVSVRNSAGADAHTGTAVVTDDAFTGVNLAATVAMIDNADSVTIKNSAGTAIAGTHAATVAAGVLSNVKLAATVAPVVNAASVPLQNSAGAAKGNGTVAVAAGVVTSVRTPATSAIVANGDTVPATGTGTTATLVIANGVVTGVTLA